MGSKEIVCWENVLRYYGDNPELIEKYRKIIEEGECSFCLKNIEKEFQLVVKTEHWNVVFSNYPYKNSALHFLVIPARHIISLSGLTFVEWGKMEGVIMNIMEKYPVLSRGYGLAVREKEIGGVTLYHLHWHLIVPKIDQETECQILVNFGIG